MAYAAAPYPSKASDLRALHLVQAKDGGRQRGLGSHRQAQLDTGESAVA
jgi:hypothetical protein